jgi:Holliday junction DNA helicase RuvA
MIGRISGKVAEKHPPRVIVDVQGVGYELETPMSTYYELPETGQPVTLRVHQAMRDEVPVLYGFLTDNERGLFRRLVRVNGVGPKMALAILSGMSAEEFRRCIEQKDIATLNQLPGIGRKIAERLTLEMQDRLDDLGGAAAASGSVKSGAVAMADAPVTEAHAALVALGYKSAEAQRLLKDLDGESSEMLIRAALQKAVR